MKLERFLGFGSLSSRSVNVLGHEYVAEDEALIALADLFEDGEKKSLCKCGAKSVWRR
jgi:hypothetical protein